MSSSSEMYLKSMLKWSSITSELHITQQWTEYYFWNASQSLMKLCLTSEMCLNLWWSEYYFWTTSQSTMTWVLLLQKFNITSEMHLNLRWSENQYYFWNASQSTMKWNSILLLNCIWIYDEVNETQSSEIKVKSMTNLHWV